MKEIKNLICVSLDSGDENEIANCINEVSDLVGYFKINYAFTKYGPQLIKRIKKGGNKVFLDLKLHDIPNTIKGYAKTIVGLGVDIVTVHIAGGREMMGELVKETRLESQRLNTNPPLIIGVSILTSIDKSIMNDELNIIGDLESEVYRRAKLAKEAGLDGIVCSPKELGYLRESLPEEFFYITPGIRISTKNAHDHKRVSSYEDALNSGSKLLVIGREIMQAKNRRDTILQIYEQMSLFQN